MNKARLNLPSLIRMAERHRTSIVASAYRSPLLGILRRSLERTLNTLRLRESFTNEELIEIERDLEVVEAALIHLWVSLPYNEALTTVSHLPTEQIFRLKSLVNQALKGSRAHLRLVDDQAA